MAREKLPSAQVDAFFKEHAHDRLGFSDWYLLHTWATWALCLPRKKWAEEKSSYMRVRGNALHTFHILHMAVVLTETSSASRQWDWDEIHPSYTTSLKSDQLSVNMLKKQDKLGQIVKILKFFRLSNIETLCPSKSFHATNHMEAIEGVIVPQTISKRSACRTIKLAIAEVTVIKSCGLLTLEENIRPLATIDSLPTPEILAPWL